MLFKVENLTAGYEKPLLQDISFEAEAGQLISILGRNGSGKTSLLRAISGSIHQFSGEVWVKDTPISGLSPKKKARLLALLPQRIQIMEGITPRQLMAMGLYPTEKLFREPENDPSIEKTAEILGIRELLDRDSSQLSQGQRQLVLLGRLLVQAAPVNLLDEPNAALDFDNTHVLFSILRNMVKNGEKTAVLVLHDPELALRWCDRVLLLHQGRLAAQIHPKTATEGQVEAALRLLYPAVSVKKDPVDGTFRCYVNNHPMKEC